PGDADGCAACCPDPGVPARGGRRMPAGGVVPDGADGVSHDAGGLGQPGLPDGVRRVPELSGLVLAAAQIPGIPPGRIFLPDTAVRRGPGRLAAGRAGGRRLPGRNAAGGVGGGAAERPWLVPPVARSASLIRLTLRGRPKRPGSRGAPAPGPRTRMPCSARRIPTVRRRPGPDATWAGPWPVRSP